MLLVTWLIMSTISAVVDSTRARPISVRSICAKYRRRNICRNRVSRVAVEATIEAGRLNSDAVVVRIPP